MADFYGALETTSFQVKDDNAFLADPEVLLLKNYVMDRGGFFEQAGGLDSEEKYWSFGFDDQYPSPHFNISCETCDGHGTIKADTLDGHTPCEACEGTGDRDLDMTDILQRHLADGQVVRLAVSGQEKLRYIGGVVCVVTNQGTAYTNLAQVDWDFADSPENVGKAVSTFVKELRQIGVPVEL